MPDGEVLAIGSVRMGESDDERRRRSSRRISRQLRRRGQRGRTDRRADARSSTGSSTPSPPGWCRSTPSTRRASWSRGPARRIDPLYVICRSGSRGRQAAEKFQAAGYPNVVNVEGGTLAWERAGFAGGPGKEGDLAGAAGADRRRVAGRDRHRVGGVRASRPSSACRRSSGRDWSSPGSRTPAAWGCSWPGCPGTGAERIRRPAIVPSEARS